MKRLLISLMILMAFQLNGQINVKPITTATNINDKQGFVYTLPYNLIQVDFEVLKTENIPGPYADYAAKYLDLQDVVTTENNEYKIVSAGLKIIAIPDPDHVYFAEITDKQAKEGKDVILSLTQNGLITGYNRNFDKNATIEGSSLSLQNAVNRDDLFSYFAETNLYEMFDTIIQKVVVDTAVIKKVYLEHKWVEKSDEQKAVEAANKISKIREARYNLLSGYQEISYQEGTMKYMDEQLALMEKEYLSLFMGISITKSLTYSFTVDPKAGSDSDQVPVCVFSEKGGIKELNAAGGEKIYVKLERMGDLSGLKPVFDAKNTSGSGERGFYYRVPGKVKADLNINRDLQITTFLPISQFGVISSLPPSVTSVRFYESTGALKEMIVD